MNKNMETTLPLEEQSIYQIYLESQETLTYKIPIYQRNYAWEEDEITALIKDVHDSMCKDKSIPYYIGTLVTYKRGDSEYEVIDGQQRLTTIYIILKALGFDSLRNKLTYTARSTSAETIKNLPNFGEEVDWGIQHGYGYAQKALKAIVEDYELDNFKYYFLHQVHIIHYRVPKDVDLNHYFEVMNSRGEQLEKHEIAKSLLSQSLVSKKDLATFSRIWEACSEMCVYIQQVFPNKDVFGNHLCDFNIEQFDDIPEQDVSEGKSTIINLISKPIEKITGDNEINQTDRFQPIIDFPNFLLIVLKLTLMEYEDFEPTNFALDDKELLFEFQKAIIFVDDKEEFTKLFAFNLLKAKYMLDNYMVHHVSNSKEQTGDNPWMLQYYYQENSKKKYPTNLCNDVEQKELVHLLSMFEVSFTPKQRKNYLFYCLLHLFNNYDEYEYLKFVRNLADKYFYGVYLNEACLNDRNQPLPNAFDNAIIKDGELSLDIENESEDFSQIFDEIYKQGECNIPLFVFNYTDYRLWAKYASDLRGNKTKKGSSSRNQFFNELGCSDFGLEAFNNFYFSRTRKSLEHFYPRAKTIDEEKASADDITLQQVNCFGNFAMIGAEANASGSNWDPKTKLDHYNDGKADPISVASLKFKIMMQMCQDNIKAMLNGVLNRKKGKEWNVKDMATHHYYMLHIISIYQQED